MGTRRGARRATAAGFKVVETGALSLSHHAVEKLDTMSSGSGWFTRLLHAPAVSERVSVCSSSSALVLCMFYYFVYAVHANAAPVCRV